MFPSSTNVNRLFQTWHPAVFTLFTHHLYYLLGREDDLEHQLCDAEREADGIGAVDEDVLGGHDAVDGPQQGVGAPAVRVRVRVTGPQRVLAQARVVLVSQAHA